MNATPTPVTSRGEQAKNTLINAAIAQFGEYGLHATTRDIAALAGQNIAAITYYFGSKEELYMASARWIADFISHNFEPHVQSAEAILSQPEPDKAQIRELIHTACRHMISLLTADETLNLSKFISREQLSPTPAYQLIHNRVIAPMHAHFTGLVGRYTGRDPSDTETILHTHALLGQVLAFRLVRETILLRTGWTTFDKACVQQISDVVLSHVDFILQGLSAERGRAGDER
ncbi:transcriptional regulator CecR [Dryocola sp. BD613]|uniref:transcriptional regulator CecR n=1 Tax=Dryocola sp. BD613 TaxID=3133272 RepID=UPI003F503151